MPTAAPTAYTNSCGNYWDEKNTDIQDSNLKQTSGKMEQIVGKGWMSSCCKEVCRARCSPASQGDRSPVLLSSCPAPVVCSHGGRPAPDSELTRPSPALCGSATSFRSA